MGWVGSFGLAAVGALAAQAVAAGEPTVLHVSSHLPKAAKVSLDGKPAFARRATVRPTPPPRPGVMC